MSEIAGQCLIPHAVITDTASPMFYVLVAVVLFVFYLLQEKFELWYHTSLWFEYLTTSIPSMDIEMTDAEAKDDGVKGEQEDEEHGERGHRGQRVHQGLEDDLQFLGALYDSEDTTDTQRAHDHRLHTKIDTHICELYYQHY